MFKITTRDGHIIEVDNEHEMRSVLEAMYDLEKRSPNMHLELKPLESIDGAKALQEIFGRITNKTKTLQALFILKAHPDGLAAENLIKELNLEKGNKQALGGIFGGISRFLRRSGVNPEEVYSRETKENTEIYRLTNIAIKALEAMNNDAPN